MAELLITWIKTLSFHVKDKHMIPVGDQKFPFLAYRWINITLNLTFRQNQKPELKKFKLIYRLETCFHQILAHTYESLVFWFKIIFWMKFCPKRYTLKLKCDKTSQLTKSLLNFNFVANLFKCTYVQQCFQPAT